MAQSIVIYVSDLKHSVIGTDDEELPHRVPNSFTVLL